MSAATFLGAGVLWFTEPDKGSLLIALKPYAPAAMSLAGSFLAGLVIGRIARRKLKYVLIAGGIVVVAVGVLDQVWRYRPGRGPVGAIQCRLGQC